MGKRERQRPRRLALLVAGLALVAALWLALALRDALSEAGRREADLPELEAMLRRSPDDGRLLALLGGRLMEAREHDDAAAALRRALTAGEQNETVWLSLAGATAAAGDTSRARAYLEAAGQALPSAPGIPAARKRCRRLGATASPADLARAICPQGPVPLVTAYARGSFLSPALEWWGRRHPERSGYATRQRWARRRPEDAQAQRLWGLALLRNRREIEAEAALRRAVQLAPRSPAARLALADCLARSGSMGAAGLQYIECLTLRPNWLPALMGLGRTSLRDDLRYGADCFDRATRIDPRNVEAWIGLGRAYAQHRGRSDGKAGVAFETAARLDPKRTDFYPTWAEVLRREARLDAAESLLRRRLAAAPGDAEAHYLLAAVLMDHHPTPAREAEAEAEARTAIRLAPEVGAAKVTLGQLLLRRRKQNDAIAAFADALRSDPYNTQTMNVLARAQVRAGRMSEAAQLSRRSRAVFDDNQRINVLENARQENFLDVKVHEELAELYARTGQEDRARYARETARDLLADPRQVAQSLRQFRASLRAALPER